MRDDVLTRRGMGGWSSFSVTRWSAPGLPREDGDRLCVTALGAKLVALLDEHAADRPYAAMHWRAPDTVTGDRRRFGIVACGAGEVADLTAFLLEINAAPPPDPRLGAQPRPTLGVRLGHWSAAVRRAFGPGPHVPNNGDTISVQPVPTTAGARS